MSSLNVLDAVHTSPGRPKARQHDLLTVPEAAAPETIRFRDSINACRRKDASTLDAPSVRLVMAFSGNSALHPVLDAHQMICRQLQPEFRVEESWWNVHALAHPSLRDVTVADAARADIILIALHNATDPLWMLRAWVDAWSNRREMHEGALVLLLPTLSEEASNSSSIEEYLHEAARIAPMDFFVNTPPPSLIERTHAPRRLAAKLPCSSESTRCWGINE
jgi:hypothetical protein